QCVRSELVLASLAPQASGRPSGLACGPCPPPVRWWSAPSRPPPRVRGRSPAPPAGRPQRPVPGCRRGWRPPRAADGSLRWAEGCGGGASGALDQGGDAALGGLAVAVVRRPLV